ncbi:serine/threonine-protein kinase [Streptomyces niveus]|uniref:serine/threonine-protein kinase n=1 Tax=Streptomyces niveus TaxID=193462 RepID=UPI0035D82F64
MRGLGDGEPGQVGGYRLLGRLGAGGMGDVYLARSGRGRTVAIKLVREELAAQEEFRARFRYEVEAARRVGGHWTAPVLDADTEAAVPWVATGYVAGPSLRQVVGHDHGPLPEYSVRTLAAGLAHALRDIHGAGIVHRDLKPSNVLITIDGPRVIDFGIARALETVTDGHLTRTGAFIGSPGFMAPEQMRSDRITPACDIFCLGSVLVYAATGKMPFGTAQTEAQVLMYRIAHEEPNLDGVPAGGMDLIRDCLEKNPAARPSLDEVLRRTGAQDTVADGRSHEPWLPGSLVAQLGRHAVGLLDTENPEPLTPLTPEAAAAGPPAPASPPHPPFPLSRREPQSTGLAPGAAPPHQPSAHATNQNSASPRPSSFSPHPISRKQKRIGLLILALVLALSVGTVIYNLTSGNGDQRASDEPSDTATTPTDPKAEDNVVPERFLTEWNASLMKKSEGGGHKSHKRWMTVSQGKVGDTLLRMITEGPTDDGSGNYHCTFLSELLSVRKTGDALYFKEAILDPEQSSADCDEKMSPITLTMDLNDTNTLKRNVGQDKALSFNRTQPSAQR